MSDGLTFHNETYYACIIGIDHNAELEGNHRIHFKVPYAEDGTQLAWCDELYGQDIAVTFDEAGDVIAPPSALCMNPADINGIRNNDGGWKESDLRTHVVPNFMAAMEEKWRTAISPCIKYSDNKVFAENELPSDVPADVTATWDDLWLLDTFEYYGTELDCVATNSTLPSLQKQYDYYINGNNSMHVKHIVEPDGETNSERFVFTWTRGTWNYATAPTHNYCGFIALDDSYTLVQLMASSVSNGVAFGFTIAGTS